MPHNAAQELLNHIRVVALYGNEIVALANEIAEYERMTAMAVAVQSQLGRVADDLDECVGLSGLPAPFGAVTEKMSHGTVFFACALNDRLIREGETGTDETALDVLRFADTYMASISAVALYEVCRSKRPIALALL